MKQKKSNAAIWGEWIGGQPWDFFCTFTTRYSLSVKAARSSMDRLSNFFTSKYGFKTKIFWVAEPFDTKYGYHLHALIKFEGTPTPMLEYYIKKAWQVVSKGQYSKEYKYTTIKPYIENLGAHFYVAKYLQRTDADYDII